MAGCQASRTACCPQAEHNSGTYLLSQIVSAIMMASSLPSALG